MGLQTYNAKCCRYGSSNLIYCKYSVANLANSQFKFADGITMVCVQICYLQMLTNLELHSPAAAQSFYQTYFTDILMQIFSVVTDTSHTAGLALHAQILAYMFTLVETNKITVNLGPIPDNTLYVQEYVASLLKSAFSHLTDNQIKVFVTGLFNLNQEVPAFKEHLRDFLIQIRVSVT